ncbi:MAG: T9SS type A sorting domain-containing protein [Saprospiraceae bacterium]
MKKPILKKRGFIPYLRGISWAILLMTLSGLKIQAQTCATLINVPAAVCRTTSAATYFLNNYNAGNTYSFSVISGTAVLNTSALPNVTITWNTVGNVVIVMNEIPLIGGSCTPDTIRVRVGDPFAPQVNCNDTVNVSLDENCRGIVTADMVLEGAGYNSLDYDIVVRDRITKVTIPGSPNVNSSHIGQVLEVSAVHRCSGNSCWGLLRVEDKLKPTIFCKSYVVRCGDPITPGSPGINFPKQSGAPDPIPVSGQPNTFSSTSSLYDNCSKTTLSYKDRTVSVICPPAVQYIDTIFRDWTATDGYGNTVYCSDTILVRAGSIDSIVCPPNYDGLDRDPIECSAGFPRDNNGNPHPSYTGYPSGISCRNINYTYNDIKLNVCSGTYKILREWLIVDWCTGRDTECTQLIKILDNRGPILTCKPIQFVNTATNTCTGSATIGLPTIIQECSPNVNFEVLVKRGVADPSIPPTSLDAVKDGVVNNNNNTYTINDLPVGLSWVLFRGTDNCGNTTECATEVRVQETTKPIPVCHFETVVALTDAGTARVNSISFDDGSYDNCALDYFRVRRMNPGTCGSITDTAYSDHIDFCCADIKNNPVIVILQVVDKAGNTNECMVQVTVQDKKPPVVTCLPSVIDISCGFNYGNLNAFGVYRTIESERKPIIINDPGAPGNQSRNWGLDGLVIEDCNLTTTYDSTISLNNCGVGTITRIFTFRDNFNPAISCVQTINVRNFNPYNGSTIVFPRDTIFNGCLNSTDPSNTGRPTWPGNLSCTRLIAGYDDQVFNQVENACYKILRKWTVIDDCNPNGIWTRVQVIKVANKKAPTITSSCDARTFNVLGDNCTGFAELIASATDDCTPESDLIWTYKIYLNNGTVADITGSSNNASGTFPRGTHRITWTVEDRCGNSSSCTYTFTGVDRKAPTPYCRSGVITVIMPSSGQVTVWASDLNLNSSDNCTDKNNLRYSFSPNVNNASAVYTCSQIANGVSQTFEVRIYVTDEAGNQDYCDTKIIIQDGLGNACPDNLGGGGTTSTALVAGSINTGLNSALQEAMVSINGNMPSLPKYHLTQADGKFAFPEIPLTENYIIKAEKNDDVLNGVTTQDIVAIQKHILGTKVISDPLKIVAADVNDSRSITSRDIADIRKVILGVNAEFPVKKSWRFINSSQRFIDPQSPWPLEETVNIQSLSHDLMNNNLVAVKLGDVTGDARSNNLQNIAGRTTNGLVVEMQDVEFDPNETIIVPVQFDRTVSLEGLQMQFEFDQDQLHFEAVQNSVCQIEEQNINLSLTENGKIRISWNKENTSVDEGKSVFYLVFTSVKRSKLSQSLAISHDLFRSEAYLQGDQNVSLEIRFKNAEEKSNNGFYLYQNQPNPFSTYTNISFMLPKDENASLKVYDVNGKLLKEITRNFKAGYNIVQIEKRDVANSGILFYKLETSTHRATRKMIMIE